MNRPDDPERDRPEDVDAVFSEIIADLRAEGLGTETDTDEARSPRDDAEPAAGGRAERPSADWRSSEVTWDNTMLSDDVIDLDDDEHFVPPEPPPFPRLTGAAVVVMLFFGLGMLLLIAPGMIGMGATVATPLGILALAAGLGFLLLRSREGPPPGSDPDSGAQV